jgi:subfamily B ATP-binding cassette protein HlyB/CyaB
MPLLKPPQRVSREESIWILGSLCRFHRIAFEPQLFLQRHPPSPGDGHYSPADICLAAQELGFGTDARTIQHAGEFSAMTLPCLVFLNSDAAEPPGQPPQHPPQP